MARGISRIQSKENADLRSWNVEKYTRLADIRNSPMEVEGKPPDVLVTMLELKLNLLMVCHNGRKLEEVCISPLRYAHDVICKENRVLICIKSQVDGRTNGKFRLRFPSTALCQSFCMFMSNFIQVIGYDEWFQNANSQSSSQIMHSCSSMVPDARMNSILRKSSIGSVRSCNSARNERIMDSSNVFDDAKMNRGSGFGRNHASFRSDDNCGYREALRQYPSSKASMVKGDLFATPHLKTSSYQRSDVKNGGLADVSCGESAAGDYSFLEITKVSQTHSMDATSPNLVANDTTTEGITLTNPSLATETKTSQNSAVNHSSFNNTLLEINSEVLQTNRHIEAVVQNNKQAGNDVFVAAATQTDPISVVQPNCVVNINIASLVSDEAAARFTDMCQSLITKLLKPPRANATLSKPRAQPKSASIKAAIKDSLMKKVAMKTVRPEGPVEKDLEVEKDKSKEKVKKQIKFSNLNLSFKRTIPTNRRKTGYKLRGNETPVKQTKPYDGLGDFSD